MSGSHPPIAAVVFDLFDTLVDLRIEKIRPIEHKGRRIGGTAPALHASLARRAPDVDFDRFAEAMVEVDSEFRASRYERGLELPTGERFETLLGRLGIDDPELAEELTGIHMAALRDQVRAIAHHADVLESLRARVPLALCSNFSHSETAMRVLREANLLEHLDVLIVSDAMGIRKPRPEIFHAVLDELGTAPGETLHVGDNLSADVGGASAVGCRTAWITRRVPDPEARLREHPGPPPDHQISDLSELLRLVEGR